MFIKNLGRENVFFKEKGKVFKKNLAKVGNVQQDLGGKRCSLNTRKTAVKKFRKENVFNKEFSWENLLLKNVLTEHLGGIF